MVYRASMHCGAMSLVIPLPGSFAQYGPGYSHLWFLDGVNEEEAPANTYLRAVPKCVPGFVYTELE